MAKDDDWYIPYNGPIESPPPPRTRPRGNTFGVAGMDSAPRAGTTTLNSNEDSTFGYGNTLHNLHAKANNVGRPRAGSHASSIMSQSSYTRSFFGGGTSSGGIGEAPVHSSHRDKDRMSTYSGRGLSIYSMTIRDRDKGDRGSMLSADWEKSDQRASIASFLTFGRNRSRRQTDSPSSPSSPQRGRTGSPMSYLSPRQSQESTAPSVHPPERVVMLPIADSTRPLNPRRHLAPLTPTIGPGGQLIIATPTTASGSASISSMSHPFLFPSRTQDTKPAGQIQVQRSRSFRSRSNTVDSMVGGRGKINQEVRERIEEAENEELVRESVERNQSRASSASSSSAHRNDAWYEEPSRIAGNAQDDYTNVHQSAPQRTLSHSVSQPALASVRATHPYAVVFPGGPTTRPHQYGHQHHELHLPLHQQFLHLDPHAPTPRQATRVNIDDLELNSSTYSLSRSSPMVSSHHPYSQAHPAHDIPYTNEVISPAAIVASLRGKPSSSARATKSSLRGSLSTPNLRNIFRMGSEKEKGKAEKPVKKLAKPRTQYTAETWCDALMFPRPRFRAHVISPPESPTFPQGQVLVERAANVHQMPVTVPPLPPTAPVPPRQSHFSFDTPPGSRKISLKAPPKGKKNKPEPILPPTPPPPLPEEPITLTEAALLAGEQRERERQEWNEVARASFQNRRSRSLSRPRKKSIGASGSRVRVDSEASAGAKHGPTLTKTLATGLTSLAAEAFRQPTPTISSGTKESAHGYGTESANSRSGHSRSTSESHSRGHVRNTSWGKVALKKLCDPEEHEYDGIDNGARKRAQLEDALKNDKTLRVSVKGRIEEEQERERETEMHFMHIGSSKREANHLAQSQLQVMETPNVGRGSPQSQFPSNISDSLDVPAVGIALSTPPPPSPGLLEIDVPDLSSHPYAQHTSRREDPYPGSVPLSASYAGPHPTAKDYKPRFPIHRSKSPEAQNLQAIHPMIVMPSSDPPPSADTEASSAVMTPDRRSYGPNAYAYANANVNNSRTSTLGVEEVLTRGFIRGRGQASEINGSFQHGDLGDMDYNDSMKPQDQTYPPVVDVKLPDPLSDIALPHSEDVDRQEYQSEEEISPEADAEGDISQEVIRPSRGISTSTGTVISSPSSFDSSFPGSPRPLGKMDDVEFRDLFFTPGRKSETLSLASERPGVPSRDASNSWLEDRIKSTDGLSGLSTLARQLSDEFAAESASGQGGDNVASRNTDGEFADLPSDIQLLDHDAWSPSSNNIRDSQAQSLPGMNENTLQIGTPMRVEFVDDQDFPEDIDVPESSRASSTIERESILDDTVRIGSVALSVPMTTQGEQRHSTALSFLETEDGSHQAKHDTMLTTQSGLTPMSPDDPRTSYMTTTSSTSHMDHIINDFPAVPAFPDQPIPPSRPDSVHVLGLNPPPQPHQR